MSNSNPRTLKAWRTLVAILLAVTFAASPARAQQASKAAASPAAASAATTLTEAEREAAAHVKVETIKEVTAALSAPEMQGRGTGQPGGEKAAQFIAERFRQLGLKPLGEKNSYFQTIRFREFQVTADSFFKAGEESLKMGDDFFVSPPFSGEKELSAPLVFVGYGIQSSAMGRDDLKGIDVRGKLVVLVEGPPRGVSRESWKEAKAGFLIKKNLLMQGAVGLVIANTSTEEAPYSMMADYMTRRQLELAGEEQMPSAFPPFIVVSDAGAEKLFAGAGTTYAQALARAARGEFVSQNLKPTAKIKISMREAKVTGSNVVGLLEGSDPKLKEEAVVYTAHYDAWGATGDGRFYAGAADNALGVAEIVSIAESLAAARPRRSVIFLAVTGEEYGLYGAEYWVKNPTWKLKQVAANLNFDGIGTEIYGPLKKMVGFGAEHSDLGRVLEAAAAATGNVVIPDPMPEEKAFYRSDHYAFVKRGVPALMLMGTPDFDKQTIVARIKEYEKTAYHLPTDTIRPDWNWEGPRGLAQVGVIIGLRVANAEQMPAWLQSSPFNRKRGTDEPPPPEP